VGCSFKVPVPLSVTLNYWQIIWSRPTDPVMAQLSPVAETLSALRSECELCGQWSGFTGRVEQDEWGMRRIVRCPRCKDDFHVFDPAKTPHLQAYLCSLTTVTAPAAFRAAWQVLQGGSQEQVALLLDEIPTEMPLFSIEDIDLPSRCGARWADLLGSYAGWRPLPDDELRLREMLATAVRFDRIDVANAALQRLAPANANETTDHLWRRFQGRADGVAALLTKCQ
jgi:hypothetical protein